MLRILVAVATVALVVATLLGPRPGLVEGSHVVGVAAGEAHTCAITTAGGLRCWGNNMYGQLGDGTTTSRATPREVVGLGSGVAAASLGFLHSCALTTAAGLKCWGAGYGTAPVDVPGLTSGVAAVAAGALHTCALTTVGGVKCWQNSSPTPTDVPGLTSGVAAVAAGWGHTCAVTTAGGVKCWPNGGFPADVPGLTSGVVAIAAGRAHTCALTTGGGVKCWGGAFRSTPVDVAGLSSGVAAVAAGATGYHTCALTVAGGVRCWGDNDSGQLGDGTRTTSSTPVDVAGLSSSVTAIAAGGYHSCAVTTAGDLHCWGNNTFGQLGVDTATPGDVAGLVGAIAAVSAGGGHTCALTAAGAVKCWGYNNDGQLGDGQSCGTICTAPVNVVGLRSGVAAIDAGWFHACALTRTGGVRCWGRNDSGQLGDGTTAQHATPVDVVGLESGVAAVAAGGFMTCALTAAGGVKCWGAGFGPTPADVVGLETGVATLAAGLWGACAVTTGGGVKCWLAYDPTAVAVPGLGSDVAAIGVGDDSTCALPTVGGVKCWGQNEYGQLGNGTTTPSTTPVDVLDLSTGGAAIAAGAQHHCALTTAGGVKCWGVNFRGELGNGTLTRGSSTPVDALGLERGMASVDGGTGGAHTCALSTAGGVTCWGWNLFGQLGNGATTNSFTPVPIPIDSDSDSCTDAQELGPTAALGGQRDPLSFWDFFDTPDSGNLRDKAVTVPDLFRVVARFGSTGDPAGDPLSPSPPGPAYHTAFDRSTVAGTLSGPADGSIAVTDVFLAVAQFGHTCA